MLAHTIIEDEKPLEVVRPSVVHLSANFVIVIMDPMARPLFIPFDVACNVLMLRKQGKQNCMKSPILAPCSLRPECER